MHTAIETERLHLQPLTTQDHEFIFELVNSKGWLEFISDRKVHSTHDAIAYINRIMTTPAIYYWVVRLKSNKRPAGFITFIKRSYLDYFDIGFAFLPQFHGFGYAHEAGRAVLSLASRQGVYPIVLATTVPSNVRSIHLLKKLGFHFKNEIDVENEKLHVYSSAAY